MPPCSMSSTAVILFLLTIFPSLHHFSVSSFEFQVGGTQGWVVPPANDSKIYNDWASENRFQVGDTLCFKYRKDSVMQVNETDYKRCNSSHPNFFSNTGNTVFEFDYSGPFYFISGASGHCEKGQRMIVKVISPGEETPSGGGKSSSFRVVVSSPAVSATLVFVQLIILSCCASYAM
ncbi:early nodulin-like protein 21 [Alnus glutinosa]|uniref:early nodulin-like protein 21 n=1 Tax=Alnus glutinosa TaxID=3517 RepID=UPI002D771FCB|nr:early nodulin-like protein 21 [Alnus glutinosa]